MQGNSINAPLEIDNRALVDVWAWSPDKDHGRVKLRLKRMSDSPRHSGMLTFIIGSRRGSSGTVLCVPKFHQFANNREIRADVTGPWKRSHSLNRAQRLLFSDGLQLRDIRRYSLLIP
jgi:hypothetical protein